MKNFRKLENSNELSPEILKKTKSVGASLYWVSLLTNTLLIGFGLPRVLNKFLRHNINKEQNKNNNLSNSFLSKKVSFEKFCK